MLLGTQMENIIVLLIVAFAAGLLGRNYYKKYKKGNQCGCGCTSCEVDSASCEYPEEGDKQLSDMRKSLET